MTLLHAGVHNHSVTLREEPNNVSASAHVGGVSWKQMPLHITPGPPIDAFGSNAMTLQAGIAAQPLATYKP